MGTQPAHNITLEMIASKAGVTKATVSNVLHRNRVGSRSDAVRNARRIRRIAADLGYRPNMAARAIQTRRFGAIGLLASTDPRVSVYHPYLSGVTAACRQRDLHLSVGEVEHSRLNDNRFVPKILREWSIDGLLIAYMYQFPRQLAGLIEQYRIPSIWLNAKRDHDCVHPDDHAAMRQATEHLLGLGHRRIVYVQSYPGNHFSARDRWSGYAGAMTDAGLTPQSFYPQAHRSHLTGLYRDTCQRLRRPDRPTAFVCYFRDQALTLCHAAVAVGLDVPGDLSLVAPYDQPINELGREIATLLINTKAIGRTAIDLVTRKISRPEVPLAPVAVPLEPFQIDASTAPPRELTSV